MRRWQANYAYGGFNPGSYLTTNLLLHLAVCLGIAPMIKALGCESSTSVGAVAAFLFAAHPATTHAVCSLEARGELLQGLFVVGALTARGNGSMLGACACAVAAAFSSGAATASVFILLSITQSEGLYGKLLWLVMATLCLSAWLTTYAPSLSFTVQPVVALRAGFHQWHSLLWPTALSAVAPVVAPVSVGCLLSTVLTVLAMGWAACTGEAYLTTAAVWLLLWSAPLGSVLHQSLPPLTTSIHPGGDQAVAEGSLYLLTVPWCVLLASILHRGKPRPACLGLGLVALLALGGLTRSRHTVWNDELTLLQAATRTHPGSPDAWYRLGEHHRLASQHREAEREFRRATTLLPASVEARVRLGQSLHALERRDEVMPELMRAVKAGPGRHEPFLAIGETLLEAGEAASRAKAEQSLKMALRFKPDSAYVLNTLGEMHMQDGANEKAKAFYEQAAALHSSFYEALNNLGTCLMRMGNAEQAVTAFDKALELPMRNPNVFLTHYNVATALQMLGRLDDAIAHYETSIALNGNYANFYFNMGIALQKKAQATEAGAEKDKTLDKAIAAYSFFVTTDPNDAQAHYNLGYALDDRQRKEEARRAFLKARQLNPKLPPYQQQP